MKTKKGSIIILVLVCVVFVAVVTTAFFVYYKYMGSGKDQPTTSSQTTTGEVDMETKVIEAVEKSDDVNAIQKDLNETNFSTLDQDVLGVKTAAEGL